MRLVLRRARQARGLLLAAAIAALVATGLVTGLALYNRQAVDAGQRAFVSSASAEERSLLVSGSAGRTEADFAGRDKAVRDRFAAGLGGVPATTAVARYGTGRQLTGNLGSIPSTGDGVFAELTSLDGLPAHADLVDGAWATPGGTPLRVTLPQKVAALLKVSVGDRVPLRDRAAERNSEVEVAGIWRPRDANEPYWRLAPGVGPGAAGGSTTSYGPFVLDQGDFGRTFAGTGTSAAWLVTPDLSTADSSRLTPVRQAVAAAAEELPEGAGLGSSATIVSGIDRLTDRMTRADLVGRSALLTPILLVVVLGGYALVLVAALLNEDRRAQTALLRARGAARAQIAGLAAREAALVVVPSVALAPLLAGQALRLVDHDLGLGSRLDALGWLVAAGTAAGCLLALLGPALRRGGTYVADLAARSRPNRWAVAQRASVDIVLVLLAVLAWTQLRQYSSPLAGANDALGIDPLLAAAPTLGVLAGAVIALRLLPPATRFVERFVDRKPWTATMFGMWQAGRRPHAGPVLLLALAVGAGSLAWSLVATWERSHVDQANHQVGADLRLRDASTPADRAAQLAALPGVRTVLPGWRDDIRLGTANLSVGVLAVDAAAGADVLRINPRLTDGPPRAVLDRMVAARPAVPGVDLPADARRLTGSVRTPVTGANGAKPVATTALLARSDGRVVRVPLASTGNDGSRRQFAVDLPDAAGRPLRLVGVEVDGGQSNPLPDSPMTYRVELADLRVERAGGKAEPVDLGAVGPWVVQAPKLDEYRYDGPAADPTVGVTGGVLRVSYPIPPLQPVSYFGYAPSVARFTALGKAPDEPVPAVATPQVLAALGAHVGDTTQLQLSGVAIEVRLVGELAAIPGSDDTPAAVLMDLPSAAQRVLQDTGTVRPVTQWWLATDPGRHAAAAAAAAKLPGVTVLDRRAAAEAAARDPYWLGARTGLFAATAGAVLLALVGLGVDVWATARRRVGELAVLHTLGATPRLLARALLAEQAFLAGIGVLVGLLVGAGVGATMAPLVILTPSADRPVPAPAFELPWLPVGAIAAGLLLVALTLGGLVATTIRQRVTVAQLRMGGDQ